MPKRTIKHTNTLLNYFQSPKAKVPSSPNLNKQKENTDPDSEEDIAIVKKKRNRCLVSSDSDDEHIEGAPSSNQSTKKPKVIAKESENESEEMEDLNKSSSSSVKRKSDADNSDSKIKSLKSFVFSIEKSSAALPESVSEKQDVKAQGSHGAASIPSDDNWEHNKLYFLQPKSIMDINKKQLSHPEYDEKTLFVPENFLKKQTPAMHQWWILKSKHFDSVLFFKVGKFYELYHMDAVIGVNHLALSYMKGSFAHSGFPEIAYGRMASSLIDQGFKVARVEQTETPEMMANRCKATLKPTKFDKVVKREICQITTKATFVYNAMLPEAKSSLPSYMIAIAEKPTTSGSRFGVCFVDTSFGIFHLSEFDDDKHYSSLLALMAHHPPELILIERGGIQVDTLNLLKNTFINVRRDTLAPKSQFYDAQGTINKLMEACYFLNKDEEFEWPPVLGDLVKNGSPKAGYELALKSLGACIWYLKDSEIDIQVLSFKKFKIYQSINAETHNVAETSFMILDSKTLGHLDILGGEGSLLSTINYCMTEFGERLLQQWVCRPLCTQKNIAFRHEAVKELMMNDQMRSDARAILNLLPDLERLIIKIRTSGNAFIAKQHPDSRAIFYEASNYSESKVGDLVTALRAFESTLNLLPIFSDCKSLILRGLTRHPPNGQFLDITTTLEYFKNSFDQDVARAKSKIIPQLGIDAEYDKSLQEISDLESEIEQYRCEQDRFFNCKVLYHGTGKNRYHIEIPEQKCGKVTGDYKLEGRKKSTQPVRRYSTPVTRQFVARMIKAEGQRDKVVKDLNRRLFQKFGERSEEWEQVIQSLAMLDVLCSFAEYAKTNMHLICFPNIADFEDVPYIRIEKGIHPCTKLKDFVPNSINLGINPSSEIMILTGPNMGGKSTLMRQVALITIMAQMGCPVPAASCELSLVDRIFTRIGAQDDIVQGRSTFMVELSEAAVILHHATKHSFVLIDELGRGTSTHDGNAIASAYVNRLISLQCRTIFSTHYHSLVERFANRNDITFSHMACLSKDQQDSGTPKVTVTLLYELKDGNCPDSFGFNAAELAGMPNTIVESARVVAKNFEKLALQRFYFRTLMTDQSPDTSSIMQNFSNLHL